MVETVIGGSRDIVLPRVRFDGKSSCTVEHGIFVRTTSRTARFLRKNRLIVISGACPDILLGKFSAVHKTRTASRLQFCCRLTASEGSFPRQSIPDLTTHAPGCGIRPHQIRARRLDCSWVSLSGGNGRSRHKILRCRRRQNQIEANRAGSRS